MAGMRSYWAHPLPTPTLGHLLMLKESKLPPRRLQCAAIVPAELYLTYASCGVEVPKYLLMM